MSEDMSPYCSAHDEWLILKLCMYVGYHDANNVSNFGGDPVTQLNLKTFYSIIYAVLQTWRSIAVTRSQFLRRLLRDHAQTAAVWKTIAGHTSLSTALVCHSTHDIAAPAPNIKLGRAANYCGTKRLQACTT